MNPSSSHLQDVFPVEGIDLHVCPRQCLRNDWNNEVVHSREQNCSAPFGVSEEESGASCAPLEAVQSWGAQAGAGCRVATAQGSQDLLIDQEIRGNTGRVQGNQPTYFSSL